HHPHPPARPSSPTRRSSDLGARLTARQVQNRNASQCTVLVIHSFPPVIAVAQRPQADDRSRTACKPRAHDQLARSTPNRTAPSPDRKSTRLNSSHVAISYAV